MAQMEAAQNDLNIIILDACRDNPYARSFRTLSRGLAQMNAPTSTLIAYATAPGKTASDGAGANGLYTSELLAAMRTPGLAIEDVFKQVRIKVREKSGGQQVPWEASSLTGGKIEVSVRRAAVQPSSANARVRTDTAADEQHSQAMLANTIIASTARPVAVHWPSG